MSFKLNKFHTNAVLDGRPLVLQTIVPNDLVMKHPEAVSSLLTEMELVLNGFNQRVKNLQKEGEAKYGASINVKGMKKEVKKKESIFASMLDKIKKKREEGR